MRVYDSTDRCRVLCGVTEKNYLNHRRNIKRFLIFNFFYVQIQKFIYLQLFIEIYILMVCHMVKED